MDYILGELFPFTEEEIAVAFEAQGNTPDESRQMARTFADEIRTHKGENGFAFFEGGPFLDPIARLSPHAAERVRRFRNRN